MFQLIKKTIHKVKQYYAQKKQFKKTKQYYEIVRKGAIFLQYIKRDLENKNNKLNRPQKRRMIRAIAKNHTITLEIIKHYQMEIDRIIDFINLQEMAYKAKKTKKAVSISNKEK